MRYSFILLLLVSLPVRAQTTGTGNASTSAPCTVANSGSVNKIQIDCGIGKEQGSKMLAILNKILADHLDADTVMSKLDEIIANQERQSDTLDEIQRHQRPWLLDRSIQRRMADILNGPQTAPVIVESQAQSTQNFYQGIVDVFVTLPQWRPLKTRTIGQSSAPPIIGIACFGPENSLDQMGKIESALRLIDSNIHCVARSEQHVHPDDRGFVNIIVGERP